MKFGIAFKLGSLLALFGMLPVGLAGYSIYSSSREVLLQAAERDLLASVRVMGRNLDGNLHVIAQDAVMLSNGPRVQDLNSLSGPQQRQHVEDDLAQSFRAMLLTHPDYMQIRLISASDHGLEWVRLDRDGADLARVQDNDLQEKAHFAYTFETLRLAPGQVRVSPIVINHEQGAHSGLGKPTLHVSTPVADAAGKVFALVVINVDLDQLFMQLQADLPSQYQVYLSNRWGDLLVHPDPQRTFGFDRGRRFFLQNEFPEVAQLVDSAGPDSVISRDVEPQVQDRPVAAFVRLSSNAEVAEPFVVLGLGLPQSVVLAQASRAGSTIGHIALFFGLLAVVAAFLASRALIRPLRKMTDAVELFARERTITTLPERDDELGVLGNSFRSMKQEILNQLDDLTRSRAAFEHLARHDPLTNLPNRRMCFERLELALAAARRSGEPFALVFVDLDHFKAMNDEYGHRFGDQVLRAVAALLSSASGVPDSVSRLGGDEFVIFLQGTTEPKRVVTLLE
ncbi:diguanylate cyclase domain-containing protein, partial [Pseudomonas sp.]